VTNYSLNKYRHIILDEESEENEEMKNLDINILESENKDIINNINTNNKLNKKDKISNKIQNKNIICLFLFKK